MQRLRVLARATPEDKLALVLGLQRLGQKVVMCGDSANDVDAIARADVGVAMGQEGC